MKIDLAQKVNPPLTTPYIGEQGIEQGIEQNDDERDSVAGQSEIAVVDSEPFESGLGKKLPDLRSVPRLEKPRVQYRHIDLGEIQSLYNQVLGHEAEIFIRKIDQAMVDRGFIKWALGIAQAANNPRASFQSMINNHWRNGQWENPEIEREQKARQKAADQAREKLTEELTTARNLMEMAKREFEKGRASLADVHKYTEKFEEVKRRAEAC